MDDAWMMLCEVDDTQCAICGVCGVWCLYVSRV